MISPAVGTPRAWDASRGAQGIPVPLPNFIKNPKCKHLKESVNTMTEATKVLSIRLENKDKEELSQYLNRESAESILRQIKRGEITITRKGVVIERVNTNSESVNTDEDGEWVRELAHDLNIGVNTFKKKIEQSIRR